MLIKLTAANVIQGKSLKEQVRLLSIVGFKPKQIAQLTGKTANNIRVTLNWIKRESGKNG